MANNAKNNLSWAFLQKSFLLKATHVTSSYTKIKKFCEKIHERLFLALFALPYR
jgi:hypothetical protein